MYIETIKKAIAMLISKFPVLIKIRDNIYIKIVERITSKSKILPLDIN